MGYCWRLNLNLMLGAKLGIQSQLNAPFKKKNLWGWWDANSGTYYNDSNELLTWYDKSGMGRTMWNVYSAPVYVANQVNGYPTIDFDGTDDYCTTNSGVALQNLGAGGDMVWTLFFVFISETAHGGYSQIFGINDYDNNYKFGMLQMASHSSLNMRMWNGDLSGVSSNLCTYRDGISVNNTDADYQLYTVVAPGDSSTDNELIQDETSKYDGILNSTYEITDNWTYCWMMNRNTSPSFVGGGKVAEVIIFDAALSSGDRAEVATYLNNKYSLY